MSPAELELWEERLMLMSNPGENLLGIDEDQDGEGNFLALPNGRRQATIQRRASAASSSGH